MQCKFKKRIDKTPYQFAFLLGITGISINFKINSILQNKQNTLQIAKTINSHRHHKKLKANNTITYK